MPVSTRTPQQELTRQRVEGLIGFLAPALDVVLWIGERVSRAVERDDSEPYPVRSVGREVRSPIGGGPAADYDEQATVG